MKDPVLWMEDTGASPGARTLLEAARADLPSAQRLERIEAGALAAIAGGAAVAVAAETAAGVSDVAVSAGSGGAAAAGAGWGGVWGALKLAMLAGAAAALGASASSLLQAGPQHVAIQPAPALDAAGPVPRIVAAPPQTPQAAAREPRAVAPAAPASSEPHRSRIRRRPPRPAPMVAPTADTPPGSAEDSDGLRELGQAQRLLVGNPAAAAKALREHGTRWPNSVMAQEREALLIEALGRSGRTDEARTRAGDLLERRPTTPYRARIRRWLDAP